MIVKDLIVTGDVKIVGELQSKEVDEKAPAYTYGTADLTAGSSPLETGKLYFVYE
jgi:hypothetical protein